MQVRARKPRVLRCREVDCPARVSRLGDFCDAHAADMVGGRQCRVCGEARIGRLVRDASRPSGRANLCRTCDSARSAAYHARYPERARAKAHVRRARQAGAGCPSYTAADWAAALDATDCRCVVCYSPHEIEIGHLTPLAIGGCNGVHNVAPMCRDCNRGPGGQHARPLAEWLPLRLAAMGAL